MTEFKADCEGGVVNVGPEPDDYHGFVVIGEDDDSVTIVWSHTWEGVTYYNEEDVPKPSDCETVAPTVPTTVPTAVDIGHLSPTATVIEIPSESYVRQELPATGTGGTLALIATGLVLGGLLGVAIAAHKNWNL